MSDDLMTIYVVDDSLQAELIRARLDTAGIANFLKADDGGGTMPHIRKATGGIRVVVRKEDAEQAAEIIDQWAAEG